MKSDYRMIVLTQPELIVHVTEASSVVLPVPVEFQLSILAPEEDLRRTDFYEQGSQGQCGTVCY